MVVLFHEPKVRMFRLDWEPHMYRNGSKEKKLLMILEKMEFEFFSWVLVLKRARNIFFLFQWDFYGKKKKTRENLPLGISQESLPGNTRHVTNFL